MTRSTLVCQDERTQQVQAKQSALLPTYPQHLLPTLTPRQLRATLVGQRYYQEHQHGTYATHAELCAFIKARYQRWQYDNTSVEWQIHFIGGWHAAVLADPTAETERPAQAEATQDQAAPIQGEPTAPAQAGPEGGNDGGWSRQPSRGDDDEQDGEWSRRPTYGKDDDEDRAPGKQLQDDRIKRALLMLGGSYTFEKDGEEGIDWPIALPDDGGAGGGDAPIRAGDDDDEEEEGGGWMVARAIYGPENDDEPGEAPIKAGEPTGPNYGEPTGPLFAQARYMRQRITQVLALRRGDESEQDGGRRPTWEPEDDDEGSYYPIKRGGDYIQATGQPAPDRPAFRLPLVDGNDGGDWFTIRQRPQRPEEDDGNGQRPAILPTDKPAPGGAAVVLVSRAQQAGKEAQRWS